MIFFNGTATTEIYTLSLHDALPICDRLVHGRGGDGLAPAQGRGGVLGDLRALPQGPAPQAVREVLAHTDVAGGAEHRLTPSRSEEHTSELQSRQSRVCRLLLAKKKI